jgi:hypothetical protein
MSALGQSARDMSSKPAARASDNIGLHADANLSLSLQPTAGS